MNVVQPWVNVIQMLSDARKSLGTFFQFCLWQHTDLFVKECTSIFKICKEHTFFVIKNLLCYIHRQSYMMAVTQYHIERVICQKFSFRQHWFFGRSAVFVVNLVYNLIIKIQVNFRLNGHLKSSQKHCKNCQCRDSRDVCVCDYLFTFTHTHDGIILSHGQPQK